MTTELWLFSGTFQDFESPLKSLPTGVGEAEDAGWVSVSGRVESWYPASKVPPDVVDVVVPVDRHGRRVGRTHRPQRLADRPPHLRHLTWGATFGRSEHWWKVKFSSYVKLLTLNIYYIYISFFIHTTSKTKKDKEKTRKKRNDRK